MAQAGGHIVYASLGSLQDEDMGTVYISYSYVDENGEEEIYWFPYDMIVDGDTGVVKYVPRELTGALGRLDTLLRPGIGDKEMIRKLTSGQYR